MKNFVFAGLLGLVCFASSASAQSLFLGRPATTPPTRPFSTDPRVQLYAPPQSTYGLFPQGVPPAGSTSAFQAAFQSPMQGQAAQTGTDVGTPSITGHPTRFNAYSHYYNTVGGGASTGSPVNQISRTPAGGTTNRPTSTPAAGAKSPTTSPTRR